MKKVNDYRRMLVERIIGQIKPMIYEALYESIGSQIEPFKQWKRNVDRIALTKGVVIKWGADVENAYNDIVKLHNEYSEETKMFLTIGTEFDLGDGYNYGESWQEDYDYSSNLSIAETFDNYNLFYDATLDEYDIVEDANYFEVTLFLTCALNSELYEIFDEYDDYDEYLESTDAEEQISEDEFNRLIEISRKMQLVMRTTDKAYFVMKSIGDLYRK